MTWKYFLDICFLKYSDIVDENQVTASWVLGVMSNLGSTVPSSEYNCLLLTPFNGSDMDAYSVEESQH